jgi:hypothetical protein
MVAKATSLHELRESVGRTLIADVEAFVSTLAGHPKEFDKAISDFNGKFEDFSGVARQTEEDIKSAAVNGATGAGLGFAAGAATVGLGPTAAMAVATTFGTASTGTAIASLSGASATKAALAWLGGGAIAAGGGGMASGSALLALAGPIGWGIAGVAVAGGGFWYAGKNRKIAEEADASTLDIQAGTKVLDLSKAFIDLVTKQTLEHTQGLRKLLTESTGKVPGHYSELSDAQLDTMGAIINHVHVLTELMQRTVSEYLARYDAVKTAKARLDAHATMAAIGWSNETRERVEAKLTEARASLDEYCGSAAAA